MTSFEKIILPVITVAVAGVSVLWVREQRMNTRLSRDLKLAQDRLSAEQAANEGLAEANRLLQARLQQVPVLAVTGESARTPEAAEAAPEEANSWDLIPAFAEEVVEAGGPEPDQTPTPEEQAAREEREQRRQEWLAEREKRREEFRQRMTADLQARREFFSQINTDGLAPEYVEANRKLIDNMARIEANLQAFTSGELSREERRELGREMWQLGRETSELMGMQRDVLLTDYASLELGLDREQTQNFMDYMEVVRQYTTMPGPGGGRGRGR